MCIYNICMYYKLKCCVSAVWFREFNVLFMSSGHCVTLMLNSMSHRFMHLFFSPAVTLSESSLIASCPHFISCSFVSLHIWLWGVLLECSRYYLCTLNSDWRIEVADAVQSKRELSWQYIFCLLEEVSMYLNFVWVGAGWTFFPPKVYLSFF